MTNLQHWLYFEKVLRYLVNDIKITVDSGYDYNLTVNIWDYTHTFRYRDWEDGFSLTANDPDGYTIDEVTAPDYLKLYEWLFRILEKCY